MASCEHLLRTSMYFDGELPPAEERDAVDHLATCAACQGVLGDAVGLDAVLSTAKPAVVVPMVSRRRWQLALGAAAVIAVAAIAIVVLRPKPPEQPPERVALVLGPKRSLEVRFSGATLGKHRPYEPPRDRAHESIDPRALEGLEAHDLAGALASSGELVRAAEVARQGNDAASLSDAAAIVLAAGDAEGALALAYRAIAMDPALPAAHWNLGLAARQLKYWRVSREAFRFVAAKGEPGWAAEARQNIALLDRELTRRTAIEVLGAQFTTLIKAGSVQGVVLDPGVQNDITEMARVAESIREDHTPIEINEVRRFPSHALQFLAQAAQGAKQPLLDGLEPVARSLDSVSRLSIASDTLKNPRDPFAELAAYQGTVLPEQCRNDLFAVPCVPLAWRIARAQLAAGNPAEAEHTAEIGRDLALREYLDVDYPLLAEVHRAQKREALATADADEARLAGR